MSTAKGLGRTLAVALAGINARVVEVEATLVQGLASFVIVGLPDVSLHEARDRVRSAIASCGITLPQRRITVNLVPTSLPKSGAGFDLAVAVAVLAGAGITDPPAGSTTAHIGELGLDGRVHPVAGILPAVKGARDAGVGTVVVPAANAAEAQLIDGIAVVGVEHLSEVAARYGADIAPATWVTTGHAPHVQQPRHLHGGDLCEVRGQAEARWACEVAAAGGHHMVMVGPPGVGKSMLASRLPGLLPALDDADSVEVTSLHSLAGRFDPGIGLMRLAPFEAPHHTASAAAIVGGGSGMPRPGAVSLAHRGVLFLDEAPEFSPRVLQTLRQPIEHGELTIHRAGGVSRFPARFQLIMAANPCPCGRYSTQNLGCECRPVERRRYFGRLSGPLMDRVDVHCAVGPVRAYDLADTAAEDSATVAARVLTARHIAAERFAGTPWRTNGEASGSWLRARLGGSKALLAPLDALVASGRLTMRSADRIVKLAWTVADLAGAVAPSAAEIDAALTLRDSGGLT